MNVVVVVVVAVAAVVVVVVGFADGHKNNQIFVYINLNNKIQILDSFEI